MDHPRKFEHTDSSYQSLGVDASLEETKGVGMGAHGTKKEEENKDYGEQNQNQPALKAAATMPQLQDDADLNMICRAFRGLRLSELDRIFQRTQFPNVFVRKELGVSVNVEAEAEPGEPEEEVSE